MSYETTNPVDDDAAYQRYMDMVNQLPEGWIRNPKFEGGKAGSAEAPFLHEPSGKVSWKNPNQQKIKAFMKEQNEKAQAQSEDPVEYQVSASSTSASDKHQKRILKKLRLMLLNCPLEVVERRASVEGIDMELVLQQESDSEESSDDKSNKTATVTVAPVLLKKYIRMRKMGVGLAQVQQLAFAEAKLQPEQVVDLLATAAEETKENSDVNSKSPPSAKLAKYVRMQKAGLPFQAILQAANLDGVNQKDFSAALGIISDDGETTDEVDVKSKKSPEKVDCAYFTLVGLNKVSFDGNSKLASLVRKMSHSIDKTSRGSGVRRDVEGTLEVNVLTLFHALGSFHGVQVARDNYNETCNSVAIKKPNSIAWMKSKRQAFCEIARGIGAKIPPDLITKVNVEGLDELVAFLEKRYADEVGDIHKLLEQGFYDFDSLAIMYAPGSRVVAKNAGGGGVDMICKVAWNRYQQGKSIMGQPVKYFQLCLEFVVAVGAKKATIAEVVEGMESFEGRRSLLGGLLQFIPWNAYSSEQQASLLERYRRRGQIYNQVALNVSKDAAAAAKPYSFKAYQKGSFFIKNGGGAGTLVGSGGNSSAALATGGRIIIDTQGAYDYGHSLNIGYDPMITGIRYKLKEYKLQMRDDAKNQGGETKPRVNDDGNDMVLFDCVPGEYLEFVWPCVVGFSLSAKAWGDCLVDGLEDIVFSEDVFDCLVLPEARKRLVKALVKHSAGENSFQDLISGKGEGTVFLLYGPPGVGKTLTAEAVSEVLKRPLFSVSMGTLGTTADELEKRLGEILKLSAKWDAIILLDEADSFLETRSSTSSLERNAMVSVMLKLVEYFSGILFLTSNRFDSLDPAFQTRITLSLEFDNLDAPGRAKVWDNLFSRSGIPKNGIDFKELAQFPLNGREIKNALRLALALSTEEKCALTHDVLVETCAMIKPVDKKIAGNGANCFSLFGWWKN